MDTDIAFVTGLLLIAFAIPAGVSAYSDGERLTLAGLMSLCGSGAIFMAVLNDPAAYHPRFVDDVIVSVLGRLINS